MSHRKGRIIFGQAKTDGGCFPKLAFHPHFTTMDLDKRFANGKSEATSEWMYILVETVHEFAPELLHQFLDRCEICL
jgi:hypothetical protein